MSTDPPEGYAVRPATLADAEAITEVINATTRAEIGIPWTTLEETRGDLSAPGRDPDTDLLLVDEAGGVVGYLDIHIDTEAGLQVFNLAFIRPDRWGQGFATYLLTLGEELAQSRLDRATGVERCAVQVARFASVEAAGALFATLGYRMVRTFWEMTIDLDREPKTPAPIEGIAMRSIDASDDIRSIYDALADGLADHWGNVLSPFERWRHRMIESEGSNFDPGLWFVALDGDRIVGAVISRAPSVNDPESAEVDYVAVRRPWRRRGIALELLLTTFRELRVRGTRRAKLGVDADSSTGATQLYERAGMQVALSWEFWEKELHSTGP